MKLDVDIYSTKEVCNLLECTSSELTRIHRRGGVPVPGTIFGRRAYTRTEVERLREVLPVSRMPQTGEVSRMLGVAHHHIWHAWDYGYLEKPKHVFGSWPVWTPEEIEAARRHFGTGLNA